MAGASCRECGSSALPLSPFPCSRCGVRVCGVCETTSHVACSKCSKILCRACRSDNEGGCEEDSVDMMRAGCCGRVFCGDCVALGLPPTAKFACGECTGVLRGSAIYTFTEYEVRVRAELRERWALTRSIERAKEESMRELQSLLEEQLEVITRHLVATKRQERLAARRHAR